MAIRLAKTSDIPTIERFLEQILAVHHEARPDLFKEKGKKYDAAGLEELMASDHKAIFVYEDEAGQVLGHLFVTLDQADETIFHTHKTLFIDDLCVDEAARGQHIGQQLLDFARQYAKEQGCYNLTLHVWNDNQGALSFYEREGFKPQYTAMEDIL